MRMCTPDVLFAMFLVASTALCEPAEQSDRAAGGDESAEAAAAQVPPAKVSPYLRAVRDKSAGERRAETVVISNDDLFERYGPSREPPPATAEPAPASVAVASGEPIPAAAGAEAGAAQTEQPAAQASALGAKPGSAAEPAADAPVDALQQIADDKAAEAERRGNVSAAEEKVEEARRRISDIERRMRALRNPLLARPAPPEEGREEWDRGDTGDRVELSQSELDRAREELATAEQELARARNAP